MKKALLGIVLAMMASSSTWGQSVKGFGDENVPNRDETAVATGTASVSSEAETVAAPAADTTRADALPEAPAPAPTPTPKYVFGDRDDYRWQLEIGVNFIRFQSNIFNASMTGTNTTVNYYTNSWFGLEGNLITGFAPTIYDREHVKYFSGGGGIRIGTRRARFEPWGHVLIGGSFITPQTADNGKWSLNVTPGVGLDYRLYSRFSIRAEADYLYTRFFKNTQNNFQASLGLVFHF